MCGITAGLGVDNIYSLLLLSLGQLQNRGYDSAGIATIDTTLDNVQNTIVINKYASTIQNSAIDKLQQVEPPNSRIGIGHTRWATHGPKTDLNSHPHLSSDEKVCIVHNGIIENYSLLKQNLLEAGYTFKSQTDSEVIANLISQKLTETKDIQQAIQITVSMLEGTWGLAIICTDYPKNLYCTRHGSPLLVSYNEEFAMVTSEQVGFCGKVNNYLVLDDGDICSITSNNNTIRVDTVHQYQFMNINTNETCITPDPYPHWTIKEIHEQIDSSLRAISLGGRLLSSNTVKLGGLDKCREKLQEIDNLILLGCGTSYHAALVGVYYFRDLCHFNTVQLFDGAEFHTRDIPRKGRTAFILLSQSGETADLIRCISLIRLTDAIIIGIVNVVDSQIAREVDCGCYLNAGREVGVASTKSFTSQVILLSMVAIWFSQHKEINVEKRTRYVCDLRNLYLDIEACLKTTENTCKSITETFHYNNCFILGKGICEAIAREGSLKIKEISYIHSEAYSSGSLKHGPFALLDKSFPVIILDITETHRSKNENAIHEIASRGAPIYCITDKKPDRVNNNVNHANSSNNGNNGNNCNNDHINYIYLNKNKTYGELLSIIPLQYISYYLAINRGINPDYPKNLAKVVTVE